MSPLFVILSDWALALLRLVLGAFLLKLGLEEYKNKQLFSLFNITLSLLLLVGWLTFWASVILTLEMAVLVVLNFFKENKNKQDNLTYIIILAVALVLLMNGSGPVSLDSGLLGLV